MCSAAAVADRLPATVTELRLLTGEHSHSDLRLYERLEYRETHRRPTSSDYELVHHAKRRTASG